MGNEPLSVGSKIEILIRAKGITQKEVAKLAKKAGQVITPAHISKVIGGAVKEPSINMGKIIARGLEVSQSCINTDEKDYQIQKDPVGLVVRESLALYVQQNSISDGMAKRLRNIASKHSDPPRSVEAWRREYETLKVDDDVKAKEPHSLRLTSRQNKY